jgi:hypothetical protein
MTPPISLCGPPPADLSLPALRTGGLAGPLSALDAGPLEVTNVHHGHRGELVWPQPRQPRDAGCLGRLGTAHSGAGGTHVTGVLRKVEQFVTAQRSYGELVREPGHLTPTGYSVHVACSWRDLRAVGHARLRGRGPVAVHLAGVSELDAKEATRTPRHAVLGARDLAL